MNKINIPFRGMTNVPDDNFSQDGYMAVLLNMRHKGGELVQCQPPTKGTYRTPSTSSSSAMRKAIYHPQSECTLMLYANGELINDNSLKDAVVATGVKSFAIMGNIVVLYKENTVEYAIYRDGGYVELGELPALPKLEVAIKPIHSTTVTSKKYYKDDYNLSEADEGLRWKNASKGYFDECLNSLYNQSAFVDRTLFRLAARLFDGSYVCFSPVYYVQDSDTPLENIGYAWLNSQYSIGRDNQNFFSKITDAKGNREKFFVSVRGFVPSFTLNADIKDWRDIITSIDLFATPSIMGHESRNDMIEKSNETFGSGQSAAKFTTTSMSGYDRYVWKGAKKIREEVAGASQFFKIAEFDLEGKETWRLKETSPSQMAVQTQLPYNAQPHVTGSEQMKPYNSRLHLAGVTEILSDGYTNFAPTAHTTEKVIQITSVVTIETEEGRRKVVTTDADATLHKDGNNYFVSPLLCYPDARATNMRLFVAFNKTGETLVKYRDFPLTAHKGLNLAYYLADAEMGADQDVSITTTAANVVVEIEENATENPFIAAVKKNLSAQATNNYSGTYDFKKSGDAWNLTAKIGSAKETINGVSPYQYGIRMSINGAPEYGSNIADGKTITVVLKEGTGVLAGIKPIEVYSGAESAPWVEAENKKQANFIYENNDEENGAFLGFTPTDDERRDVKRVDVMKVSAVDNPFYFPVAQTYKFEGSLVGLASNAEAISTGQFGQYPLFVFTKDGIWAMSVDVSGKGAYVSQSPFSREVCSGEICPVSGGIVFATERGLMAVSGGEVVELSAALDGMGLEMLDWSKDLLGVVAKKAGVSIESIMPIRDYLKDAKLAYNYLHNEVIVSNSGLGYSYVYSLDNKEWGIIDSVFDVVSNKYPELIVYDNGSQKKLTFNDENTAVPGLLAITRPIKVDGVDFKRLRQAALRCTFDGSLNFYVLGSNDGASFRCITGKEFPAKSVSRAAPPTEGAGDPTITKHRDLVTAMSRSKQYKYIAVAVAGKMKGRVSLTELLVDGSFANEKLR